MCTFNFISFARVNFFLNTKFLYEILDFIKYLV